MTEAVPGRFAGTVANVAGGSGPGFGMGPLVTVPDAESGGSST